MKYFSILLVFFLVGCQPESNNSENSMSADPSSVGALQQITPSKKLVIFIPGGSFTSQPEECVLNPNAQGLPELLGERGWLFKQLCYPVYPEARFPTPHQTIIEKITPLIAEYESIILIGSSAGATVSLTALIEAGWNIDAFIGFYGVYDIHSLPSPLREEVMAAYSDDPIIASPVNYPLPDNTPVHLIHSLDDEMVPYTQSLSLCDSCTTLIPNLSHGFPLSEKFSEISRILDNY